MVANEAVFKFNGYFCKSQRKTTVKFAFRDTSKPMGVATYRLASEWPEQYRGILPDAQTLKQLL